MTYPEAERQFYLAMAGIQVWYARAPLSGAGPSPRFDFPDGEPVSIAAEIPRQAQPAPQPPASRNSKTAGAGQAGERIANLQALMTGTKPAEAPRLPPVPAPEVSPDVPAPDLPAANDVLAPEGGEEKVVIASSLKVTLGVWAIGGVVLVSGVSEDASDRLQDALANNILAALGFDGRVTPDYLRWPVFANPLVPGNGFGDFSRLLASMAGESGGRQLILLGVMPDSLGEDREVWLARTLGKPVVDFANTLAELAAVPAYKRALWQELKPLVRGKT